MDRWGRPPLRMDEAEDESPLEAPGRRSEPECVLL